MKNKLREVIPMRTQRRIRDGRLHCARCDSYKEFIAFRVKPNGCPHSYCKLCNMAVSEEWARRNPEKRQAAYKRFAKTDKAKAIQRRYWYGLSEEQYRSLISQHNGQCAICKRSVPLCLDHCHTTKAIRGMLCRQCNAVLGMVREQVPVLESAIAYLRRMP